jgi:hypothetical protein
MDTFRAIRLGAFIVFALALLLAGAWSLLSGAPAEPLGGIGWINPPFGQFFVARRARTVNLLLELHAEYEAARYGSTRWTPVSPAEQATGGSAP